MRANHPHHQKKGEMDTRICKIQYLSFWKDRRHLITRTLGVASEAATQNMNIDFKKRAFEICLEMETEDVQPRNCSGEARLTTDVLRSKILILVFDSSTINAQGPWPDPSRFVRKVQKNTRVRADSLQDLPSTPTAMLSEQPQFWVDRPLQFIIASSENFFTS
jgi:hypothetical protein